MREGWGLTVIEANRVLTPVVAYGSQGLKDSIVNGKTGILCNLNTPEILSDKILYLHENREVYKKMQKEAFEWSNKFTWEKTGAKSIKLIKETYESNK